MRVFKLFTGLVGFVMMMVAIAGVIGGVVLFAWSSGDDGADISFDVTSSERIAVVGDADGHDEEWGFRTTVDLDGGEFVRITPDFDASVTVSGPKPLFIGIGPADEVRRFADSGTALPGDQDFWVAQASGTDVTLDWAIEDGNWAAVLMNADGTPGITANVETTLPGAPLRVAGGVVSVVGLGVAVFGGYLMVTMWRDHDPVVPAAA